jgi:hypothetical protein
MKGCKSKLGSFVKHCLFHFAPWQEQAVTEQATLSDPQVIFFNNFRKTKTATAPLAAKIVQYYGPQQKMQHSMSNMSMIAKFQSQHTIHQLILRTLLDRRLLLLDCEREFWPSCPKTFSRRKLHRPG